MALSKSLLSFPIRVSNFFLAAYYGKITCGLINNGYFDNHYSFSVEHYEIVDFYCVLVRLMTSADSASYPSLKLNFGENNYWQVVSNTDIVLGTQG
jgi:hypothetical protein